MRRTFICAVLTVLALFSTTIFAQTADEWLDKGMAEYDSGNYETAVEYFTKVIELDPDNVLAYNGLGEAYVDMSMYDEAEAIFDALIERSPSDAGGYIGRGGIYYEMGEYSMALEDFTTALSLAPDNIAALSSRAGLYWDMGMYDEALADANRSLELEPRSGMYYMRGLIYLDMGDVEKAKTDLTTACDMGDEWACDDLKGLGD